MEVNWSLDHGTMKLDLSHLQNVPLQCVDLSNVKKNAKNKVEPHRVMRETCFLMLVSNLAEPDWISVSCEMKILHWIICDISNITSFYPFIEEQLDDKINYCSPMYIMFDNKCILFIWLSQKSLNKFQCVNQNAISVPEITVIIQSILDAVTLIKYPMFLFCSKSQQILLFKYERYLSTYRQQSVTEVGVNRQEGFYTFIENKNTTFTDRILFHCNNETYILQSQVCNGKIDCHYGGKMRKVVFVIKTKISVTIIFVMLHP